MKNYSLIKLLILNLRIILVVLIFAVIGTGGALVLTLSISEVLEGWEMMLTDTVALELYRTLYYAVFILSIPFSQTIEDSTATKFKRLIKT